MLIHLAPKLYEPAVRITAELLDISIPECNMLLRGGKEIVARRPYPNKCYLVACRNKGQKAMHGLFIDVPGHLDAFSLLTRWQVNGKMLTHSVDYQVLDRDFDTISEDMVLWCGLQNTPWTRRWPDVYRGSPADHQPRMDVLAHKIIRPGNVIDEVEGAMIIRRHETFPTHTIERERLWAGISLHQDRMPAIEDAFIVSTASA